MSRDQRIVDATGVANAGQFVAKRVRRVANGRNVPATSCDDGGRVVVGRRSRGRGARDPAIGITTANAEVKARRPTKKPARPKPTRAIAELEIAG